MATDTAEIERGGGDPFAQIEALIAEFLHCGDAVATDRARRLVGALLEAHREGLSRLLERVHAFDGPVARLPDALAADPAVASLLMIHGLHPVPFVRRLEAALADLEPRLAKRGSGVTLLGANKGVVRLRLHSSCDTASSVLRGMVEDTLLQHVPDALHVEIDEAQQPKLVQIVRRPA